MLSLLNPYARGNLSQNNAAEKIFEEFDIFKSPPYKMSLTDNLTTKDGVSTITIDVPGVKEEDLTIELNSDNYLIIKGERKTANSSFSIRESIYLSSGINAEDIKADLKDGVLTVIFKEKMPEKKKTKLIPLHSNK